ncbi:MAG: hypothetical protein AB7H90_19490 [Alphaproteobacteria bacterium]
MANAVAPQQNRSTGPPKKATPDPMAIQEPAYTLGGSCLIIIADFVGAPIIRLAATGWSRFPVQ